MGKSITKNGFTVEILPKMLSIQTLKFSPSESVSLASALGWAGRMAPQKVLPPTVSSGTFVVTFNEDGNHSVSREGTKGNIYFTFQQVDGLVEIVNMGLEAHKTLMEVNRAERLRGRGRTGSPGQNSPDIIDGRG
jgi:hypothetical protein